MAWGFALGSLVGEGLGVGHDAVEQLVHPDEVGAPHVPVSLLAVDDQRLQVDDDGGQQLRGSGGDVGGGREFSGLRGGHEMPP